MASTLFQQRGKTGGVGAAMKQTGIMMRFADEAEFDCFLLACRHTLIDHALLRDLLPLCAARQINWTN